jgi:hypothetical protein
VARARWLVQNQPPGGYNLVGRNCETVALWCTCGMAESLQRQVFQVVWSRVGALFTLYQTHRSRRGRLSPGLSRFAMAFLALRVLLLFMYYHYQRRFYEHVRACAL